MPARLHDAGPPVTLTLRDSEILRLRIGLVNSLEVIRDRASSIDDPDVLEILDEHRREIRALLSRLPLSSARETDPGVAAPAGDIVDRLADSGFLGLDDDATRLLDDAADEIVRLRAMIAEHIEARVEIGRWTVHSRMTGERPPAILERRAGDAYDVLEREAARHSRVVSDHLSALGITRGIVDQREAIG